MDRIRGGIIYKVLPGNVWTQGVPLRQREQVREEQYNGR